MNNKDRLKVLWLANVPSPYRVDFFNELGKSCDLTVLFEKRTSDERDQSWLDYKFDCFTGVFLKGKSINTDTAICLDVIRYVKDRSYDYVIVTNVSSPTSLFAVLYMKMHRIAYCLEGDGAFPQKSGFIKTRIKCYLFHNARLYFSTSQMHDEYFLMYGANKDRIVRYPFTSLKENDLLYSILSRDEKEELKKRLCMEGERVVITVGRMIYGKGFDVLLKSWREMPANTTLYIIGGNPTDELLDMIKELNISRVHFLDYKSKQVLFDYYKASDLFVFPTRGDVWGLVVNEAMACGLPVVSTNRSTAGLELVKDGWNGYVIPSDDSDALGDRIRIIISDDLSQKQMGINSLSRIQAYTIEKMAKRHMDIFTSNI